jgi:sugar diacid utilization regulator
MVSTLLGLELERTRAPAWEADRVAGDFVSAVLTRETTDRDDILARGAELGAALGDGAGVVIARATPHAPQTGEWRERVLTLATRALQTASRGALLASRKGESAEVAAIVPCDGEPGLERAAGVLGRELAASLEGFAVTVARSRWTADPVDLYRAGKEALLAANVGEAEGREEIAFEQTGAYRLLLPAMSEDPGELERFYEETVAPLVAYDDQYETDLLTTIETFLDNDGNVTPTAERLFTHRHTVRYRLERVKELCGHDVSATEGREKLGLGLKAMRVLGIASPSGPAQEPGAKGGKVARSSEE